MASSDEDGGMAGFLDDFASSSDDGELPPHKQPAAEARAQPEPAATSAIITNYSAAASLPRQEAAAAGPRTAATGEPTAVMVDDALIPGFSAGLRCAVGAALAEVVPVDGGPTAVAALHGLRSFTEAPACAVGWCPQPTAPAGTGPVSLLLAVGTYLLEPEAGTAEAEAARQARLSGTPEPEPEAAPADSASEAAVAAGLDAPGLRDADPDKREQQRRQQTRSGTIRLYSVQLAPVEHPLPVPQGSGRKNEPGTGLMAWLPAQFASGT